MVLDSRTRGQTLGDTIVKDRLWGAMVPSVFPVNPDYWVMTAHTSLGITVFGIY